MNSPAIRLVGINHVALVVGDLAEAIDFYGRLFAAEADTHEAGMAFLQMGDQFLALVEDRPDARDGARHFGLVVDDKAATRRALQAEGVEILPGSRLDFLDPWGNRVQVVDYREIMFRKAPPVLAALGLEHLDKTADAQAEIAAAGLA